MRRLPIFILVDTSGKMQGERIELINRKISELISNLRQEPFALETAFIFVASYDMDMQIYLPLTDLTVLDLPIIKAKPSTPSMLGNALYSLDSVMEQIINKSTENVKGDYGLILYILSGGKPSDGATVNYAMEKLLIKWNMNVFIGLTSSNFVQGYENIFNYNATYDVVITDLSTTCGNFVVNNFIKQMFIS
jgi:uncharacterized protein YegL